MKIQNLKVASMLLLGGTLFFTACKKDKTTDEDKLSTLSAEEHKTILEDEGIAIINSMNHMANLKAYEVVSELDGMLNEEYLSSATLNHMLSFQNKPQQTASTTWLMAYDEMSLSDSFDEETGIYTWNKATGDWDKTESESTIEYNFEVDNVTAKMVISNFNSTYNSLVDEEVPTSLEAKLTLGSETLCQFSYAAEFNDEIPTYAKETFFLEDYNIESILDLKDKTVIKTDNKFEFKGENILAFGFSIDGNFNMDEIEKEFEKLESDGNVANQSILDKANAYFQVGSVKAEAYVDAKSLIQYLTGMESETVAADEINKHVKTLIRYTDRKEIFAQGEFFNDTFEDTYYEYTYNEDTQAYESKEVTETYEALNMKMTFTDGSAMNADYFNNSFGTLIKEFNEMIVEINNNYEMDLEEM